MKKVVAKALADRVCDGEVIGLGSGTTVEAAIKAIGERVAKEKLSVSVIPTSYRVATVARDNGIAVLSPFAFDSFDWAFDGADEVDPDHNLIKGRGAAMLAEKIMLRQAKKMVIIVTEEKLVAALGASFAIPVEVIPNALDYVSREILALGAKNIELRGAERKYGPVVTETGNLVLDARFSGIGPELEGQLKSITGVVESGLFWGCDLELLVAKENGVFRRAKGAGDNLEELLAQT